VSQVPGKPRRRCQDSQEVDWSLEQGDRGSDLEHRCHRAVIAEVPCLLRMIGVTGAGRSASACPTRIQSPCHGLVLLGWLVVFTVVAGLNKHGTQADYVLREHAAVPILLRGDERYGIIGGEYRLVRTKRRSCDGKRSYSKRAAKAHLKRRAFDPRWGSGWRAYRCKHCGQWHLGHFWNRKRKQW
jgi:hypothetical protein